MEGCRITGNVLLDGEDIYGSMDTTVLEKTGGHGVPKAEPIPHDRL